MLKQCWYFLCWQSLEYAGFKVLKQRTVPKAVLHVLNCAVPDEIEVPSGRKAAKGILMWLETAGRCRSLIKLKISVLVDLTDVFLP